MEALIAEIERLASADGYEVNTSSNVAGFFVYVITDIEHNGGLWTAHTQLTDDDAARPATDIYAAMMADKPTPAAPGE
jgi:hypothetical protein